MGGLSVKSRRPQLSLTSSSSSSSSRRRLGTWSFIDHHCGPKIISCTESLRAVFYLGLLEPRSPPGLKTPWFLARQFWRFDPNRVAQRRQGAHLTGGCPDRPIAESPPWIVTTPSCPPLRPPPEVSQGFFFACDLVWPPSSSDCHTNEKYSIVCHGSSDLLATSLSPPS